MPTANTKSPDDLDAEAYELEATAAKLHAEAARLRSRARASSSPATGTEWMQATDLPLRRKRILLDCRSGKLPATKKGRTWLVRRADADAYLTSSTDAESKAHLDDERAADDAYLASLGYHRKTG